MDGPRRIHLQDLLSGGRVFRDRTDAGAQLAGRLSAQAGQDALVLGIPRGGVPVAAEVARQLDAELDVVVARKLGVPFQPELAFGAVTANGGRWLNQDLLQEAGISPAEVAAIARAEMAEAHRREARFRGDRPPPRINGRTVIVVDDGLATGATMRAALRSVRQRQPARLVAAVPVGPPETCAALRAEADEVIAVMQPFPFHAVGVYYADFSPTGETEIQRLLAAGGSSLPVPRFA